MMLSNDKPIPTASGNWKMSQVPLRRDSSALGSWVLASVVIVASSCQEAAQTTIDPRFVGTWTIHARSENGAEMQWVDPTPMGDVFVDHSVLVTPSGKKRFDFKSVKAFPSTYGGFGNEILDSGSVVTRIQREGTYKGKPTYSVTLHEPGRLKEAWRFSVIIEGEIHEQAEAAAASKHLPIPPEVSTASCGSCYSISNPRLDGCHAESKLCIEREGLNNPGCSEAHFACLEATSNSLVACLEKSGGECAVLAQNHRCNTDCGKPFQRNFVSALRSGKQVEDILPNLQESINSCVTSCKASIR